MIEIQGLSQKEKALCDIMWTISSKEGVESFIGTLPKTDARTCKVLIELMQLAFLDDITDTLEACVVIDKFRL
jgi:hypothetical protein